MKHTKRILLAASLFFASFGVFAGATSQYLSEGLLNYMFTAPATPIAKPATVYLALCTNIPTTTVACTEPSGGGYARVAITTGTTNFTVSTDQVTNSTAVTFPAATASWGTITAFQFFDAATTGNPLWYGTLTTSQAINSGATASFAASALTITLN
jgi:hypothetical protein